jgi:hypothetical protein
VVLGAPTGERFAPVIGELVATTRRFGELDVSDEVAAVLTAMSTECQVYGRYHTHFSPHLMTTTSHT